MPSPTLTADRILKHIETRAKSIIKKGLDDTQKETLSDAKEEISTPKYYPANDYRGPKYGKWLDKTLKCEQTVLLVAAAVVRRNWIRRLPAPEVLKLSKALLAHPKFEKLEDLAKKHFPESTNAGDEGNTSTAPHVTHMTGQDLTREFPGDVTTIQDAAESSILALEYFVTWSQTSVIELFDEQFARAVSCPDGRQITMIFPNFGFRCLMTISLDLVVAKRLVQRLFGFIICLEGEKPPSGGPVVKCPYIDLTGLTGDVIKEILGARLWEHIEAGPDRATELQYGRGETECVRISVSHLNSCLSISISTELGTVIRRRLE